LAASILFTSITTIGVAAPAALAEVVHLNDGTTVTGEIKKAADGWYVTEPNGKTRHVPAGSVRSIELSPRGDPREAASAGLASLRRSVGALSDLNVIIARYERFVEQNKDAPAVADARKDLAEWRDRQARGLVRVGGQWVTAEERAGMQEKALAVADAARDLLKQNRLRDADATVTKALQADPNNPSALYLKGLILFRQDQIPAARKAFEQVREAMPDHGPALNNLAVIQWRQNQQVAALNTYLLAMQAMPMNKELLNNVAEALNALPESQRNSQAAQKVYRLWAEQDTQLQQQMMPLGWYRWGSGWVDKAQYEKLQAAEKEVKDKIAKMEQDFADAQAKVDTIDAQVKQNRDAMRAMEQSRFQYDASGRLVSFPLPPQYWDYDRANRRLDVQRQEQVALLDALRAKAQVVRQQLPQAKFSGVQLAIGVEGTPAVAPAGRPAGGPANLQGEVAGGGGDAAVVPGGSPETPRPDAAPKPVEAPAAVEAQNPVETPKAPAGERPLKY
jgi:tetratricopeptide (TPR) repeat protein